MFFETQRTTAITATESVLYLKDSVACETTQCRELQEHRTGTSRTRVLLTASPRHVVFYTVPQVHLTPRQIQRHPDMKTCHRDRQTTDRQQQRSVPFVSNQRLAGVKDTLRRRNI